MNSYHSLLRYGGETWIFFFFNSLQLYKGQLHRRCWYYAETKERASTDEQSRNDLGQALARARRTPPAYQLVRLRGLLETRLASRVQSSPSVGEHRDGSWEHANSEIIVINNKWDNLGADLIWNDLHSWGKSKLYWRWQAEWVGSSSLLCKEWSSLSL